MTLAPPSPLIGSRRPALLLIATVPAFIAYLAVAITTLATKADSSSAELTPGQLTDLGASWVALHVLWMVPSILAIFGLAQLGGRLQLGSARSLDKLVITVVALASAYLVPQLLAFGVDRGTWGDSSWFVVGLSLSLAVGWIGTIPATLLVTLGLLRRGIAPRTARTIAVLISLYLLWEIGTYASAALGPATFTEIVGPPPFLLGFLWMALGIRLARELRSKG